MRIEICEFFFFIQAYRESQTAYRYDNKINDNFTKLCSLRFMYRSLIHLQPGYDSNVFTPPIEFSQGEITKLCGKSETHLGIGLVGARAEAIVHLLFHSMSRAETSSVLVFTPRSCYIRGPDGALSCTYTFLF